jgi:hypothetical protein
MIETIALDIKINAYKHRDRRSHPNHLSLIVNGLELYKQPINELIQF